MSFKTANNKRIRIERNYKYILKVKLDWVAQLHCNYLGSPSFTFSIIIVFLLLHLECMRRNDVFVPAFNFPALKNQAWECFNCFGGSLQLNFTFFFSCFGLRLYYWGRINLSKIEFPVSNCISTSRLTGCRGRPLPVEQF